MESTLSGGTGVPHPPARSADRAREGEGAQVGWGAGSARWVARGLGQDDFSVIAFWQDDFPDRPHVCCYNAHCGPFWRPCSQVGGAGSSLGWCGLQGQWGGAGLSFKAPHWTVSSRAFPCLYTHWFHLSDFARALAKCGQFLECIWEQDSHCPYPCLMRHETGTRTDQYVTSNYTQRFISDSPSRADQHLCI